MREINVVTIVGAALDEGRPKDPYGDGHAAERIVSLLAGGEG